MARIYHSIDVHDGIQQYKSKHYVLAWQRNGPREVRGMQMNKATMQIITRTDRLLGDESGAEDDIP